MGACHSNKKRNFGLTSKLDKKLESILDKEYPVEEYHPDNYNKNFNDITNNVIENSMNITYPKERSHSIMRDNQQKSPKIKKRLKRKKKNTEKTTQKPAENVESPYKNQVNKAIILKEVPSEKKGKKKKVKEDEKDGEIHLLTNTNYYELLDNLDKSNNYISQNLDYEVMNEEFLELKSFIDKKLELLSKKEYQLNLLKSGIENHFSKETNTNLDVNILSKKIEKKLKKVNSKAENLTNLNDQLYKFMSNTQSSASKLSMNGVHKAIEEITKENTEVLQYQKTLSRRGSLISPNPKFLQKNMKKKSSFMSPCPLFPRKDLSHPSPLFFKENSIYDGINSCMLKEKVEKKIEQVEQDNQQLEFLTNRLKKQIGGDKEVDQLLTEVEEKIIGKFKKVHLDDLENDNLDDSDGLVAWSDIE